MKKFKSPFRFQLPDRQILFDFWDMDIGDYLIINTNALNYFTPHPPLPSPSRGEGEGEGDVILFITFVLVLGYWSFYLESVHKQSFSSCRT